ncbi:MAG: dephospho-CoA kinase [Bryobacterales bacterium]|nr:dephospho-CoA kinase [Bryobacterales bacterium]
MGLTGGLASGKSFVADILVTLGCHLLKADEVGHRLLEPNGAAFAPVVEAFGPDILGEDGRIDRARLGAIVFQYPSQLERLNAIVHPLVFDEEERFLSRAALQHPGGIGIVEAAILIETGNHSSFDKILVAWCPPELQVERAMHRGMSREAALARMARQMPLGEKLSFADAVIDTSGDKEATRQQVLAAHRKLREWAAVGSGPKQETERDR